MPTDKKFAYVKSGSAKTKELLKEIEELDPSLRADPDAQIFDVDRALQLYVQFSGDVVRTGHALGVPAKDILKAADRLGWNKKLEAILELQKSGKPGDIERGVSRAMCFVQAHRWRVVLERLLDKFYAMSSEELFEKVMSVTTKTAKDGTVTVTESINTKPFADLSAALEKVHGMCYAALNDTVTERGQRKEAREDAISATQLHSMIASAMAAGDPNAPAAQVLQDHIDAGQGD
jgi:hypothetical protein